MTEREQDDHREQDNEPGCRHCGAPEVYIFLQQRGPWMELICDICGATECGVAF